MAEQQRPTRALSILELIKFSLYGKSTNGEQFGSPTFKVSVLGGSLVSFTCYPNSASEVENEYINLSLHQHQLQPFLSQVAKGLREGIAGEYILERKQVQKRPDGEEKRIDGELYVKVDEEGAVSIGVKNSGKTFITFGIRDIPGYMKQIPKGITTGNDIELAAVWFEDLRRTTLITGVLLDQGAIRKIGGENVSGGDHKQSNF